MSRKHRHKPSRRVQTATPQPRVLNAPATTRQPNTPGVMPNVLRLADGRIAVVPAGTDLAALLREPTGGAMQLSGAGTASGLAPGQRMVGQSALYQSQQVSGLNPGVAPGKPIPDMPKISPKKPLLQSLGATGTAIFSGIITSEEYNSDFFWKDAIQIYEQMIRNDAQIYAITNLLELPIRRATWSIEPGSDDPHDQEIASFVESCLFDDMRYVTADGRVITQKWDDTLRHILMMLRFGFMAFEQCWRVEDGWVKWARWTPLLPRTIWRWWVGTDNELAGVNLWTFKNYSYQFIDVPADKLLLFVHRQEGNNYEGVSVLRSAYKHWWMKDQMYKIQAIDIERNAVAIPIVTLPENFTDQDVQLAQQIGGNMRANELATVTLPPGWKLDFPNAHGSTRGGAGSQIDTAISHHDTMIARNILGQFINLGSTETGAFALDASQKATFLASLQAECEYIQDVINADAIRRLVDYNFTGVGEYPRLKASKVLAQDFDSIATALQALSQGQFIHPDPELEDFLRNELGLPSAPASVVNAYNPTSPSNDSQPETDAGADAAGDDENGDAESQDVQPNQRQQAQDQVDANDVGNDVGSADEGDGGSFSEGSYSLLLREAFAAAGILDGADAVDKALAFREADDDRVMRFVGGHPPGYTQNRGPGGKWAAGDGGQGRQAGDGEGGTISVQREGGGHSGHGGGGGGGGGSSSSSSRATYHLRHTDKNGNVVHEEGKLTLTSVNSYAGQHGVGEKLTGAHFQTSEERAAAKEARASRAATAKGKAEADGASGKGASSRIEHTASGAPKNEEGTPQAGHAAVSHADDKLTGEDVQRSKQDWSTPKKDSAEQTTYASPDQKQAILGVARTIYGESHEVGVIVSRDGHLGARNVEGEQSHVEVTPEMKEQLPGNDLIHNHPLQPKGETLTDASFSPADIQVSMTQHAGGVHAVTENRQGGAIVYTMRPAEGHTWTAKDWQTIAGSVANHMAKENAVRGLAQVMGAAKGLSHDWQVEVMRNTMHSVWKQVAAEHPDIMRYSWHVMSPTDLHGGGIKGFVKGRIGKIQAQVSGKMNEDDDGFLLAGGHEPGYEQNRDAHGHWAAGDGGQGGEGEGGGGGGGGSGGVAHGGSGGGGNGTKGGTTKSSVPKTAKAPKAPKAKTAKSEGEATPKATPKPTAKQQADAKASAKGKAEADGTLSKSGKASDDVAGLHQKAAEWQAANHAPTEVRPQAGFQHLTPVRPELLAGAKPFETKPDAYLQSLRPAYGDHQIGVVAHSMTIEDLRGYAKSAGLKAGGSKADLVSRVTAHATNGHYSANFGHGAGTSGSKPGDEEAFHAGYKAKIDKLRADYAAAAAKKGYTPRQLAEMRRQIALLEAQDSRR